MFLLKLTSVYRADQMQRQICHVDVSFRANQLISVPSRVRESYGEVWLQATITCTWCTGLHQCYHLHMMILLFSSGEWFNDVLIKSLCHCFGRDFRRTKKIDQFEHSSCKLLHVCDMCMCDKFMGYFQLSTIVICCHELFQVVINCHDMPTLRASDTECG